MEELEKERVLIAGKEAIVFKLDTRFVLIRRQNFLDESYINIFRNASQRMRARVVRNQPISLEDVYNPLNGREFMMNLIWWGSVNIKVPNKQASKDKLRHTFERILQEYISHLHTFTAFRAWTDEPTECPKISIHPSRDEGNQWVRVKVEDELGFGLYYPAKYFNLERDLSSHHNYIVVDIIDCTPPIEDLTHRASKLKL
jgi:hypothetical protein